jgi:7-cyano-7-deazaguanosine (preQ0) biosynthesis protein QueE
MTHGCLAVSEVFGPTFQGEGPSAGWRCGFVRLGRCNLSCSWCDSAYTWDWARFDPAVEVHAMGVDEIVQDLEAMAVNRVVVSGGEPLLQQDDLVPLLQRCASLGWAVEVETNGTVAPLPAVVELIEVFNVSPKLANSGIARPRRLRPEPLQQLRESGKAIFKFVACDPSDLDEIAVVVDEFGLAPVWVMPEGTTPDAVLAGMRALADDVANRGWNLSARLHVLVWGDERGR